MGFQLGKPFMAAKRLDPCLHLLLLMIKILHDLLCTILPELAGIWYSRSCRIFIMNRRSPAPPSPGDSLLPARSLQLRQPDQALPDVLCSARLKLVLFEFL